MYTYLIAAFAGAAIVSAQTASPDGLCGPDSNCETFTAADGVTGFRIKDGMGIGSADYSRRFGAANGNLTTRSRIMRREDVTTKVSLGDTWLDWGCDTDPVKILDGLNTICKDDGTCDTGSPSVTQIKQLPNGAISFVNHNLELSASATYENADVKNNLISAILTTTDPKVVQKVVQTGGAIRDGGLACTTTKFPNFLQVTRFVDGSIQSDMQVNIKIDGQTALGLCATVSGLVAAITGLVPGVSAIASGFFGVVSAACSAAQ